MPHGSWIRRGISVAGCLLAVWSIGCDDSGSTATAAGTRVVADGVDGVDKLRFVVKREGGVDAGDGFEREVVDRTVQVGENALAGGGYRVPDAVIPEGAGDVYIHVIGLSGDEVVAVGDGAASDGASAVQIALVAYDPACDVDGDTYQDCGNLRAGCCAQVPAEVRPAVEDCTDDPSRLMPAADLKRRAAEQAHNFAPLESDRDYALCSNGVDDDCRGGDQACAEIDSDEDGVPLAQDCDDADPTVGAGFTTCPVTASTKTANGEDGFGTDGDGDGYLVDDPRPDFVGLRRRRPHPAPVAGEIACNEIDEDCREGDLCVDGDLDGDGRLGADDCDDADAGRYVGLLERCGDGIDQDCDGVDLPCAADDADNDGVSAPDDCDDADPNRAPGLPERCGDEIDQDCDGSDLRCPDGGDADGDKWLIPADCDDNDPSVGPGQPERCDQRDNDCDGRVDEGNPLLDAMGNPHPATCHEDVGTCQRGPQICTVGGTFAAALGPIPKCATGSTITATASWMPPLTAPNNSRTKA